MGGEVADPIVILQKWNLRGGTSVLYELIETIGVMGLVGHLKIGRL